ncbi:hypothetical protein N665_0055s0029 [Sinapis alba]|nr:hypothetical protein N665_0055s0029 [Sinapis alba]
MDTSSTPNGGIRENEKDVEGDEGQELLTLDSRGKRKESSGGSEETCKVKKSPRVHPTRSKIWNHFTRTKENRDKFLYNYCKKAFCCSTRSGTSNLLKHISICKQFRSFTEGQNTNEMMVLGKLPLCFIESIAWKHFCKNMDLEKPVSRTKSTRDIVEMRVERKAAMKKWFKASKQKISFLLFGFITCASYMVVIVHFIDDCWRLKKLILGFKNVIDHNGSENI